MAALTIAAGLSIEDIDLWSSTAKNYKSTQDVKSAFHNITTDGGTQAGTLYKTAAEHGWRIGNASRRPAPARAPRPPVEPRKQPGKGNSAAEVLINCLPATNAHGYIVSKQADGVPLECLRVVSMDSQLRIAGESMSGYLAVPAYAPEGELQSVQFIPANGGKKLNLPGASMAGTSFTVGKLIDGSPINISEGIGGAWSCWKANGESSVSSFGFSNMAQLARDSRQRYPSSPIRIISDVGKELQCEAIAKEIGGMLVTMPEGEANNFDLNDLFCRDGFDVVQALLESATEPAKPEPKVHPLARFVELDGTPKPPRWVIPGFIGHGVTVIAGAHGVGKTTTMLPLALTAAGLHGDELLPVHWRHVVYVQKS